MAQSQVQTNRQRIQFQNRITEEFFFDNLFASDMGNDPTAIIERISDLQAKGGTQVRTNLITQLRGKGVGRGTLVGNEEALDDYGCPFWVDRARNAVTMSESEAQEDDGTSWEKARPLLSNWGIQHQENATIEAMMALPSESPQAGLKSDDGEVVNGLKYEDASATQRNTWHDDNSDRVLYGKSLANFVAGDHAASLANIGTTDLCDKAFINKLKQVAVKADPKIGPTRYNSAKNRRYFKVYCGSTAFGDLKNSLEQVQLDGYPRNVGGNPVFQDGDIFYNGMIIREVPDIDIYAETVWPLSTAGAAGAPVYPVFLAGQSALGMPWARMPTATTKKEDDYGEHPGRGISMMYGIGKKFKKQPKDGTALVQWGIATGFVQISTQ